MNKIILYTILCILICTNSVSAKWNSDTGSYNLLTSDGENTYFFWTDTDNVGYNTKSIYVTNDAGWDNAYAASSYSLTQVGTLAIYLSTTYRYCDTSCTGYTTVYVHKYNPTQPAAVIGEYPWTTSYDRYMTASYYRTRNNAQICIKVSEHPIVTYNVSGDTECVEGVALYIKKDSAYKLIHDNTTMNGHYEYKIFENETYKLIFGDAHEYEFTCDGEEIYDYSACEYVIINLKDYCGNEMRNTSVDIYKSDGGEPSSYEFVGNYHRINPIELPVDDIGEGKMLDIYFDTDMGTHHQIEYCIEQTIDILHPLKWWSITFEAYDVDTELPIENMRVTVNQSCVIDPTHPLKQYLFTGADGKGTFIGLSASVLSVMQGHPDYLGEAGYTNFDIDPFGDAFCTYWSIATYFNKSSGEWSEGNVSKDCNIHFKDQNGYVDNHINDTDTYVDLYYDNGNCSATLKFQRLYGTYWMSKMSWNIPINESGYKRIYNVNFSEYDANYRGYMYATECSCNSTMPLYVANETVQEEQHYENLSTYIRFDHQLGASQVDHRSPVEIATYAYTNTSAYLLNINLTLYEQTTQIATIALDWADFAGASPKWYYTWAPSVNYDIGKNYTVVMTGYNGLNLGADDVWTSNIRNNKLTICVKDNHNSPINYATVFIEGWGSQALEASSSAQIEGFDNGDIQYKATKSGYTSSGWATVTLNDGDETVTCILIKESTTRVTGYKLRNDEIKDFFIPVMYLLLMFMLIGAFFHVAGKR